MLSTRARHNEGRAGARGEGSASAQSRVGMMERGNGMDAAKETQDALQDAGFTYDAPADEVAAYLASVLRNIGTQGSIEGTRVA